MGIASSNMRSIQATTIVIITLCLTACLVEAAKPRKAKDWDKILKEEEERLFKEEEEEREARKPPMPSMDPESLKQPGAVEAMMAAQKGGKMAMIFVTVLSESREKTEEYGAKFRGILKEANGVDAAPYTIEDDKQLWTLQDGHLGMKLIKILQTMPEVAEIEWDNAKHAGPAKAAYDKKNPPKPPESKDNPPADHK